MDQNDACTSVFKNETPRMKEYTALWVALIKRRLKDRQVLLPEEEAHEK